MKKMTAMLFSLAVGLNTVSMAAKADAPKEQETDVLLIGGGIMSATLGTYLHELQPDWSMTMVERLDGVAQESSNGWNNAGTGHSALAELNYTPEDKNGNVEIPKAVEINEAFASQAVYCQQKLGIPDEKVVITVDQHGNTSAASIPLALAVAAGDLGSFDGGPQRQRNGSNSNAGRNTSDP